MEIEIFQLIDGAKAAKGVTVIIDVFRAFTVEAYIMNGGAENIIPIGDINFAYEYKNKHPEIMLVGERGGKICDGFDLGNSPYQIVNSDLKGKTVLHTTSAGTQGIANAKNADVILTGSLVNAKATAKYIKSLNPDYVSLVCMGLEAKSETEEDTLCAEYIKSILLGKPIDLQEEIEKLKITSGAKFFDKNQNDVFPEEDFYLSTKPDIFNFVLKLKNENGLGIIERIDMN